MNRVLQLAALVLPFAAPAYAQRVVEGALVANLPLEEGSWPADAGSKVLAKGEVVSLRSVPVREAVVMVAPVQARKRVLPAGLALARVTVADPKLAAWCDVRAPNGLDKRSIDCLADTNGDGKPDRLAVGLTAAANAPLSVSRLVLDEEIAPAAVRPAKPAERPMASVGLRYCHGAGPTSAFAVAMKTNDTDWADQGECAVLGAGDVKVAANTVSAPKAAPSQARGTSQTEDPEELHLPPLKAVGPMKLQLGTVKKGDAFLSVPVAHGLTGRLKTPVKALGLFAMRTPPLPAGQPVFGIPMSTYRTYGPLRQPAASSEPGSGQVVWCAPRAITRRDGSPGFSTVCLPRQDVDYRWTPVSGALFVDSFALSASTSGATAPAVELGPVDFGAPMTLVYRYHGASKKELYFTVKVETPAGDSQLFNAPRPPQLAADGSTVLRTMMGRVKITPSADRQTAEIGLVMPTASKAAAGN